VGFKTTPHNGMIPGMGKLTKAIIEALKEPGRYADGDGLYLKVSPSGGKSWVLRIQIKGTRRDIGLGDARALSDVMHLSLRRAG
jgi:hypothetical protein